ncbi:MAG: rhodanese-like domain-containing protein, partial [Pseudomonadota bacterium]|nr:rhodanese-like domain-containing protein [Pseudomonadota bacterium]
LISLGLLGAGVAWLALRSPSLSSPIVPEVTIQQAKALIEAGAMVLDVRAAKHYAARHLPSALLFPLEVLEAGIPASLAASMAKTIVVYCSDGVRVGPAATQVLLNSGFAHAHNMTSGIEGWASSGMPVVTGA